MGDRDRAKLHDEVEEMRRGEMDALEEERWWGRAREVPSQSWARSYVKAELDQREKDSWKCGEFSVKPPRG